MERELKNVFGPTRIYESTEQYVYDLVDEVEKLRLALWRINEADGFENLRGDDWWAESAAIARAALGIPDPPLSNSPSHSFGALASSITLKAAIPARSRSRCSGVGSCRHGMILSGVQ